MQKALAKFTANSIEDDEVQELRLIRLKNKIDYTTANRPTYSEAISGITRIVLNLRHALNELTEIFERENEYALYQEIYERRKSELDKLGQKKS
ncbi:MAG: hypothetical protein J6K82_03580 [Alphaproteobacteria bacterium]|nr:hypothetical protein [Alphaproteobacteria bacterium]